MIPAAQERSRAYWRECVHGVCAGADPCMRARAIVCMEEHALHSTGSSPFPMVRLC